MYTVIDLFAGAGGLSLGFQQTKKYDIKVAYESNPQMQETYKKNHQNVDLRGDVCGADYQAIIEKYGNIDVVIGGPPCQGFSNANRQRTRTVNQNNNLVKEYVRAICELKPKAFVMENVSMLRSDTHRFFLSHGDQELVDNNIRMKDTELFLLHPKLVFDGIMNIIWDKAEVNLHLWPPADYHKLNVIFKFCKNSQKLVRTLEKYESSLKRMAKNYILYSGDDSIRRADCEGYSAILDYYNGEINEDRLLALIAPAIKYQRMLSKVMEIYDNDLEVKFKCSKQDGISAKLTSLAVLDYIKAMLCPSNKRMGYKIVTGVLNAADFGAPQKRMRFIIMGVREDVASSIKLPVGQYDEKTYRTVADAIKDIEDVDPGFDVFENSGIILEPKEGLNELASELRDSDKLYNHVITRTTDVAMQRFKAIKQGQNFHSLDDSLKKNTYTNIERTQNTIYLRLDYNKPSGTVLNVRKSMWIHPTKNRAVSIREAARLQTFPDSFIFCGTKDGQYQQVGNAVPPIMARAIAECLAEQLENALAE